MTSGTIIVVDSAVAGRRQDFVLRLLRPVAALSRAFGRPRVAYRVFVESALPRSMRGCTPAGILRHEELVEAASSGYELAMRELNAGAVPELAHSETGDLHRASVAIQYADATEALHFAVVAARKAEAERVLVVSTSRWRARYLVAELRSRGFDTRALSLPDERRDGSTLSGTPPDELRFKEHVADLPSETGPKEHVADLPSETETGPKDVLLVAESTAMLGTMLPVARVLRGSTRLRTGLIVSERIAGSKREGSEGADTSNARPKAAGSANGTSPASVHALSAIARQLSSRSVIESEIAAPAVAELLDRHAPRLLVIGNDRIWSGQLMARMAQARNIPVLCVQDGLAVDGPSWWVRTADFTATNGDYLRDVLVRLGAAPETVFITGQPRMDAMYEGAQRLTRASAREDLGLDPGVRYVLLALQGLHDTRYLRQAVAALTSIDNVHVIVRPHHWQSSSVLKASVRTGEADGARSRVSFRSNDDIGTLLRAVDVVVSQYSTILVEAALMRTPALALSLSGGHDPLDLVDAGIALGARSGKELKAGVGRALSIDSAHLDAAFEAASHMLGQFDGRSAERVARLVEKLVTAGRLTQKATAYQQTASAAGSPRTRGQEAT